MCRLSVVPQFTDRLNSFYNGGILFSALTLAFICLISLYSFLLLVKAKFVVPGSFGGRITCTVTLGNPLTF